MQAGSGTTRLRAVVSRLQILIALLIAAQLVCSVLFLHDVTTEFPGFAYMDAHFLREAIATVGLFIGIAFEVGFLHSLMKRKASLEHSVGMASSALQSIIDSHFDGWKLTSGERDVALFLVKGLSISESASLRGTAEGTVKAHLNAIYRKANVRSRAELMSHIMDSLVEKRLLANAGR